MEIEGKTICITGASRGIGLALCGEFARRGAGSIVAVGRTRGELPEKISSTLISFVKADLASRGAAAELARIVATEHGDCSVLVNNAGSQLMTDCVAPDAGNLSELLGQEIQLNFMAPITLGLHLMPVLLRHREAAICNITSGLALAPKSSAPVYCAAKSGLSSYTRALRYQALARCPNVKVFEALPPLVDTEMTKGRGRGKISAQECAQQIVEGILHDRPIIDVGKSRLLRLIMRVSPGLGYRIMRGG